MALRATFSSCGTKGGGEEKKKSIYCGAVASSSIWCGPHWNAGRSSYLKTVEGELKQLEMVGVWFSRE